MITIKPYMDAARVMVARLVAGAVAGAGLGMLLGFSVEITPKKVLGFEGWLSTYQSDATLFGVIGAVSIAALVFAFSNGAKRP